MNIRTNIPNTITSLNLFFGCVACVCSFKGQIDYAVYFIILAAIMDFFDGFSARLLSAISPIGKQLDSLADLISFGMAPACLMYYLSVNYNIIPEPYNLFVFILVIFAALRLAKFNIDENQTKEFIGLPTPAMALFVISIVWFTENQNNAITELILNKFVFIGLIILIAFSMVLKIKLFSLKISNLSINENKWQFSFILLSIILIILFQIIGLALVIILYLAMSLIKNFFNNNNK
jgi:CDP-diacylglycerol---serine O-phosphatidyltransferase